MKTRINKNNRWKITNYILSRFDEIAKKKNNRISLIDLWDVQFEAEKKYNISDYQSQKLTTETLEMGAL